MILDDFRLSYYILFSEGGVYQQVSKSPSELEVVLGIIKSYSKALLDKEATSAAKKHLFLLEVWDPLFSSL